MNSAHMDDHRACGVTSVHTLSTTKKTENKCSAVDGQAQTLLLTRVAKTTSTWRLGALPTAHSRTQGSVCSALSNSSYSLFEIHICCGNPTKQLAKQPGPSTACSDLRTNNKQFGLKAITSQIEKQPAIHARTTTSVHRATHAENYAHCVNCDTNCFETSNANLIRDSFNLLAPQRIRSSGLHRTIAGVQSLLHHVVTFIDVSRFTAVCSTI